MNGWIHYKTPLQFTIEKLDSQMFKIWTMKTLGIFLSVKNEDHLSTIVIRLDINT